jgi:hypothetical protein
MRSSRAASSTVRTSGSVIAYVWLEQLHHLVRAENAGQSYEVVDAEALLAAFKLTQMARVNPRSAGGFTEAETSRQSHTVERRAVSVLALSCRHDRRVAAHSPFTQRFLDGC